MTQSSNIQTLLDNIQIIYNRKNHIENLGKKKVLIVGGGPVGLFTGIKFLEKNFKVTVVEQRSEYSRQETFMLQNSITYDTLSMLPKELLDTVYKNGCIINAPPFDIYPQCYRGYNYPNTNEWNNSSDKVKENYPARLVGITMSTFEDTFKDYFIKKGGIFIRPQEKKGKFDMTIDKNNWKISFKYKQEEHIFNNDDYDVIIGADGGNSRIRNELLDDAKNPENGEGIEILYLINKNHDSSKNRNTIQYKINEKFNYIKTNPGDDVNKWLVSPDAGYGLIGYVDEKILKSNFGDRIKESNIDIQNFIDNDFPNIKKEIDSGTDTNTVRHLFKNKKDFISNPESEYESSTGKYIVTSTEEQAQHRYRFFLSRDKKSYFAVNLEQSEYASIYKNALYEAKELNTNPQLREVDIDKLRSLKKFPVILASLFAYYGFIDNIKNIDINKPTKLFESFSKSFDTLCDNMKFSVLPLRLYKTNYYASYKKLNNTYKYCATIGDSTIGVHYYSGTGVNVGIKNANELVNVISKFNWTNNNHNRIVAYNNKISSDIDKSLESSLFVSMDWSKINTKLKFTDLDSLKCINQKNSSSCKHREYYIIIMKELYNYINNYNEYPMAISHHNIKNIDKDEVLDEINKLIHDQVNLTLDYLPEYLLNRKQYEDPANNSRLLVNKVCNRWNEYVDKYGLEHNKKFDTKQANSLRIVTYNVRYGEDRCNKTNNFGYNDEKILEFVNRVKPDILCLQEVPLHESKTSSHNIKPFFHRFNDPNKKPRKFDTYMKNYGYVYDYCFAGWVIGNAIYYKNNINLSKVKFDKWPNNSKPHRCMTGLKFKNTNIITTHLEINNNPNKNNGLTRDKNAKYFVDKLNTQNIDLDNTIILGDFNAAQDSNILNLFKSTKLISALDKKPPTTSLFDEVVDHILIPKNYKNKVNQCDIYLIKHSDHFPIILDINL